MSLANALHLYRVRLRARCLQECFAILGIAAGVALLFAAQISSASLQSSVGRLARGIAGNATLQVLARSPEGFPQSTLARVRAIPGVRIAAPVLEAGAQASGPRGSAAVQLIGVDSSLSKLGGTLVRHAAVRPFAGIGAVMLPAQLAGAIGVSSFGQEVHFQLAGRTAEEPLYEQLSTREIGPLASSPVAIVPLSSAQEITGLTARLSRILIEPAPGAQARVKAAVYALAGDRLDVAPIDYEERLFTTAAAASSQSTALFSAVSALVGFLFAFNAVLFTVPQRRRLIRDLRRDGYAASTVIAVIALDALILGLIACALGLALGDELSIHFFRSDPAFLSLAFAVGSARTISSQSALIAFAGGMLAALVAVLAPLREIRSGARTLRSVSRAAGLPAIAGLVCLGAAVQILLQAPEAAILGMVLLVGALLLLLPLALAAALALAQRLARRVVLIAPHVATMELGAAGPRAVAIAATGAVAIFGSVAIAGARGDLLAGLERATTEMNASADLWVSPAGSYDLMSTAPFAPTEQHRLERVPGVRSVSLYRGGLLDYGRRRVLVAALPAPAIDSLPSGQLLQGDPGLAIRRLRAGGWAVLSRALASEHHLGLGQAFTLPSPNPTRLRVAALSTNFDWAPGSIVMNASDYARAWGSSYASAYQIRLAPHATPARAARAITRALGPHSGLTVQSAAQRTARQNALSRRALARLTQIAALIPIVVLLAIACALGAMIWQRRPRLAELKIEGFSRAQLWRSILLETLLLLGAGCLTGAIFGLLGQQLADHALAQTVNFPVLPSFTASSALSSLALVTLASTVILALPGYLAASVPAGLALAD